MKELINKTNLRNLILEKPLGKVLVINKINKILSEVKNAWVNTDRRSLEFTRLLNQNKYKK